MRIIRNLVLSLVVSQLFACETISKQDCLNSDWHKLGYDVGLKGDNNIKQAFDRHELACGQHGAKANRDQFDLGHADGMVQYCQLSNAVELGVKGTEQVINQQICADRDYPDFRKAFDVGYRLYELRNQVRLNNKAVAELSSQFDRRPGELRRSSQGSISGGLGNSRRSSPGYNGRRGPASAQALEREIEQQRRRLHQAQAASSDYKEFVYEEYLPSLSKDLVDPRNHEGTTQKRNQSEFDDRIDELLNE